MDLSNTDLLYQDPRDKITFVYHETLVRKITVSVIGTILKAFMVLHVDGLDNLPQYGACILAANHLTNLDVFPMQLALPRPLFFMGKAELFKSKSISWWIRQLGAFPVHRGASDQWALMHSRKVLAKGLVLAMFPEGTRSKGRGLSVAKTGAARLSIEKNVPILPLAISGSQDLFKKFPHRVHVHINICSALHPEPDDDPLSLTDQVMFTLARKLPVDLRGVYAETPLGFDLG
jgi:1-acyl-sn-glycerol-3-phosphate acyltransferase